MTATITPKEIRFACPCCGAEIVWELHEKPAGMLTRASRLQHLGMDTGKCGACGKAVELVREP